MQNDKHILLFRNKNLSQEFLDSTYELDVAITVSALRGYVALSYVLYWPLTIICMEIIRYRHGYIYNHSSGRWGP